MQISSGVFSRYLHAVVMVPWSSRKTIYSRSQRSILNQGKVKQNLDVMQRNRFHIQKAHPKISHDQPNYRIF